MSKAIRTLVLLNNLTQLSQRQLCSIATQQRDLTYVYFYFIPIMGRHLSFLFQILILAFNAPFQVSDLTEAAVIPLPFIILCPGCNGARQHGESWSMRTTTALDRVELGQSQREIVDEKMRSSEGSYPVDTELRTSSIEVDKFIVKDSGHPRLKGHRFPDAKTNSTSLYKRLRERRALNSSKATEAQTDKSLQNSSVINIHKDRKNLSTVSEQMQKPKCNDFNIAVNSSLPCVRKLRRRSQQTFLAWNNTFGRREWNPCVKKIVKIYHSKLQRVLTKVTCHRASFYCTPMAGGLGRCMPLKTFYASINKVLTTGCKCR